MDISNASSVNYNLAGWPTGISSRVTIPPTWVPTTNAPDYKGSLDVYWSLQIDTPNETLEVSKANAVTQGAPANFTLITLPDNCWGMNMNYGLIKLGQASDVTITVTADGSSLAPIFALYQGWDTGAGASRHDAIFFGENNPLGTTGLTYLGDVQNPTASTTISKTFTGLAAGKYELFTTVANNNNPGGAFKITVTTTSSKKNALTVNKPVNGTITSPTVDIVCGTAGDKCQAVVPDGQSVTLKATPNGGYIFMGWSEPASCSGTGDCTFTMTSDTTVGAVFRRINQNSEYLNVTDIPDITSDGVVDIAVIALKNGYYYLRTINGINGKQIKQVLLGSEKNIAANDLTSAGYRISVLIGRSTGGTILRIYDSATLSLKKTLSLPD